YDSLPRTTGAKTAELLANELSHSEMVELVQAPAGEKPAASAGSNPTPARDASILDEARGKALSADDHLKKLRFKQAADDLEKAIELYERQHAHIDFNDLVEAYLSLAVARFRLNQEEEGEKLLATVVRLDPERKLDGEKYPPVFTRIHEKMAKKVKKAERGAILVEPSSAGATVFIDGREIGKAPVLIKDVLKGTHYVRVAPPGGAVWADRVDADAGKTVEVRPQLGGGGNNELLATMSRNVLDEGVVAKAVAIAEKAGADYVVLGGVHREGDKIIANSHLLRVQTRKVCALQRVVFDEAMIGAGIEIYKVGADLTSKVELFGAAESLPTKVSRDALPPAGQTTGPVVAEVSQATPPSRGPVTREVSRDEERTVVRRGPAGGDAETERKIVLRASDPAQSDIPRKETERTNPEFRSITARPGGEGLPGGDAIVPDDEKKNEGSGNAWIWIAAGAAALVAGGATGGFLYYRAATQPVTGTATVNW
ncbi:MAG: PEGA domain-containing protein, partial [Myxococcales bacterium]